METLKAFVAAVRNMNKPDWFENCIEPYLTWPNAVLLFPVILAALAQNLLAVLICPVCFFIATWWLKQKRMGLTSRVPLTIDGRPVR